MTPALTDLAACKWAAQHLEDMAGLSLDHVANGWFGRQHQRRGRSDAEFREALIEAVEGRRATLEDLRGLGVSAGGDNCTLDREQLARLLDAVMPEKVALCMDPVATVAEVDAAIERLAEVAVRPDPSDLRACAKRWLEESHAYWDARRQHGGGAVVWADDHSGALAIYTRGEYADQLRSAFPSPSARVIRFEPESSESILRARLEHLVDMVTDEDLRAEVKHALAVPLPPEPAPTTDGLEGWGPRAVQGDGGVWTDIGGSVWVKWARGEQGVTTSRAWGENGRVSKTDGDVTPADRVALEDAWAGEQRTRLVGSTLKDESSE